MSYKKLFLLYHIVTWGSLLLIYLNFVFWSSSDLAFYLFIAGILYFILLASLPVIIQKEKQILVASFGSRKDDDVKAHVADLFFRRVLSGRISAQLDAGDQDQMSEFAENLKGMYGDEVASRIQEFYPDIPATRIDGFLSVCAKIGKDIMFYACFPEQRGGADQAAAEKKLADLYPFLSPGSIRKIYIWWKKVKANLEWQARVDSLKENKGGPHGESPQ